MLIVAEEFVMEPGTRAQFLEAHMATWRERSAALPLVSRNVRVHEATVIATI